MVLQGKTIQVLGAIKSVGGLDWVWNGASWYMSLGAIGEVTAASEQEMRDKAKLVAAWLKQQPACINAPPSCFGVALSKPM